MGYRLPSAAALRPKEGLKPTVPETVGARRLHTSGPPGPYGPPCRNPKLPYLHEEMLGGRCYHISGPTGPIARPSGNPTFHAYSKKAALQLSPSWTIRQMDMRALVPSRLAYKPEDPTTVGLTWQRRSIASSMNEVSQSAGTPEFPSLYAAAAPVDTDRRAIRFGLILKTPIPWRQGAYARA
ncbi:hypothetical protein GLOTRDRAFT_96034 [Gloeophyllum trabeum ATCC 11539]|uniref:Uncharacterized protein n=1 Tax=Gloeophyllum trabeum (strain ATCC 11539 / FP-39264 / Madison 617) TaxID=670483 RepID=S7RGS1_GLOTA|nr:uncharacterized protein GLOTRDRAFT_96034 [Gloeophyllum trabeum ATCC 11539]EPQ51764.1 hypothetical protein GLOTRDRAFT_96034 [Gloeophyllum trabeum ATCC 11539]